MFASGYFSPGFFAPGYFSRVPSAAPSSGWTAWWHRRRRR